MASSHRYTEIEYMKYFFQIMEIQVSIKERNIEKCVLSKIN